MGLKKTKIMIGGGIRDSNKKPPSTRLKFFANCSNSGLVGGNGTNVMKSNGTQIPMKLIVFPMRRKMENFIMAFCSFVSPEMVFFITYRRLRRGNRMLRIKLPNPYTSMNEKVYTYVPAPTPKAAQSSPSGKAIPSTAGDRSTKFGPIEKTHSKTTAMTVGTNLILAAPW